MAETVHLCPPGDSGVMPCCGRTPFEAVADRMTLDADLVTCPGRTLEGLAEAIEAEWYNGNLTRNAADRLLARVRGDGRG